ncbi:cryptochrome 3 [Raphanus sativus]|nr:cryptochrome 3 [Raphanus sativus]
MRRGLNLLIRSGEPEDILPSLAKEFGAHTVFAHKETCSEELQVERLVGKALKGVGNGTTKLELVWGSTMYHKDDLPFEVLDLPDIYTQYRKSVEANCRIRSTTRIPLSLGPTPCVDNWGDVPTVGQLGLEPQEETRGMRFVGGESAGVGRVAQEMYKGNGVKIRSCSSLGEMARQGVSSYRCKHEGLIHYRLHVKSRPINCLFVSCERQGLGLAHGC